MTVTGEQEMTHVLEALPEPRAGHQNVSLVVGVEVHRAAKDPCYGCLYPWV